MLSASRLRRGDDDAASAAEQVKQYQAHVAALRAQLADALAAPLLPMGTGTQFLAVNTVEVSGLAHAKEQSSRARKRLRAQRLVPRAMQRLQGKRK